MIQGTGACAEVGTASEKKNVVLPSESMRTACIPSLCPRTGRTVSPRRTSFSPGKASRRPFSTRGSQF